MPPFAGEVLSDELGMSSTTHGSARHEQGLMADIQASALASECAGALA